jgi:hypothetical protein
MHEKSQYLCDSLFSVLWNRTCNISKVCLYKETAQDPNVTYSTLRKYFFLVCEATGTEATPGLLCQPRVIVKMIVEKQMECRLAGETEVLGKILPARHLCPSQNPT